MSFKPDKICAKKFAIFRTLFSGRPRLKVKVSKSTFASRWPPRFLSEHFRPTESVRESSQLSPTEKLQKKKCPICGKCEESDFYALSGSSNQDASWPSNRKLNRCTQKWPKMVPKAEEVWSFPKVDRHCLWWSDVGWEGEFSMTTHLPGWSKMNFQKKSKPTASVAGRPSPKTLRKNKSTRSTKSEAQVPAEDCENNNSQESLEQDFKEKLDLESESRW